MHTCYIPGTFLLRVSNFDDAKKIGTPIETAVTPDRSTAIKKKKTPSSTRKKKKKCCFILIIFPVFRYFSGRSGLGGLVLAGQVLL